MLNIFWFLKHSEQSTFLTIVYRRRSFFFWLSRLSACCRRALLLNWFLLQWVLRVLWKCIITKVHWTFGQVAMLLGEHEEWVLVQLFLVWSMGLVTLYITNKKWRGTYHKLFHHTASYKTNTVAHCWQVSRLAESDDQYPMEIHCCWVALTLLFHSNNRLHFHLSRRYLWKRIKLDISTIFLYHKQTPSLW